ncbi:MAG: GAF domain-containing protein, partial [Deltaproteobacteria bacterium]|nr:GAF domain-containing protein [Deltaproteobacteria bacterium]
DQGKRAEEQIQAHHRRQAVLRDINLAVTSSLDLRAVLDILMKKIDLLLPYSGVMVWLLNRERGLLERVTCRNLNKEEWKGRISETVPPLLKKVVQDGTPVVVRDIQTDPRVVDPEFFRKHGLVSYVGIPMRANGEILGVLALCTKWEHLFCDDEIEFLVTLAGEAAIAIHNSKLYEQVERRTHELSVLYSVATEVNRSLDLDTLLRSVMQKVLEIFHFDASRIYLLDGAIKELRLLTHHGFGADATPSESYQPGIGIIGKVFETGEPLFFEDIQNDPEFYRLAHKRIALKAGYRGGFFIPIRVKDKTVGVMNFVSKETYHFSSGDVQLIHSIAEHMGIAVHNASLFEQTKKQAAELKRSNMVKDQFLSVMSHELRTPLSVIMGHAAMAADGVLGEINQRQERSMRKIVSSSEELLTMINGIMEVTKLEVEAMRVEETLFSLEEFLDGLRVAYAAPLDKEITLSWDYPPNLPVIKTDSGKLQQILQNLINNAIKFTEKGSVTILAQHLPETEVIEFKVADTGIGIPSEALPLLFEKFYQLDSSDTRSHGGAGLGLYIVKQFINLLGGTVRVETEPGRGSTFVVTVPVERESNHNQDIDERHISERNLVI